LIITRRLNRATEGRAGAIAELEALQGNQATIASVRAHLLESDEGMAWDLATDELMSTGYDTEVLGRMVRELELQVLVHADGTFELIGELGGHLMWLEGPDDGGEPWPEVATAQRVRPSRE
jgi:hypothetical protein